VFRILLSGLLLLVVAGGAATVSERLEALSRRARAALDAGDLNQANSLAQQARDGAVAELRSRPLEADKRLELALGGSIEVQAQVLARRGERAEAVRFLRRELAAYSATPIQARIQKNLNLLALEGLPAPPFDVGRWIGVRPQALDALRGRPVLLFFWAHWCGDCKDELPVIAKIRGTFGPRGLVILAPTQHYGYVARGEEAAPAEETRYIEKVWDSAFASLKGVPVPLSETNFWVYGSSTVPTEVLIDRKGIVRLYHPDVMPYGELAAAVEKILR
jgi:thiol-disulfide isomerase/thioredoxin